MNCLIFLVALGQIDTVDVRIERLRELWRNLQPRSARSDFRILPNLASYDPGELSATALSDATNTLNFVREVAGLPSDVTSDPDLNRQAQVGALLLSLSNFSHFPDRPSGMDQRQYQVGRQATEASNIAASYGTAHSLPQMLQGWMASLGQNSSRAGHRRWFLNPRLSKVGWGYVADPTKKAAFGAAIVFDQSRAIKVPYRSISWPSAAAFPVEWTRPNMPWSVTVNPDLYETPKPGEVMIHVSGPDGMNWKFDPATPNGERFLSTINTQGYGVNNAILFLPRLGRAYRSGDTFTVTITGIKTKDGKGETLSYRTVMFSLNQPSSRTPARRTSG